MTGECQDETNGDVYHCYGWYYFGFKIGGDEAQLSEISIGWRLAGIERNENEPGEWNRYEITVVGDTITVVLNGTVVNEATGCDVRPGRIGSVRGKCHPLPYRHVDTA